MAQALASDFPIDPVTTSGTALADILNRFSDSVNTCNSGSTAPVDTYPGMLWLDNSVTPSVMRIRNTANTGWDTIPTSSQSAFSVPDGTVAAPGLAWANEPGLGWFRESTGILDLVESGSKQIVINLSASNSCTAALYPRAAGSAIVAGYSAPGADFYSAVFGVTDASGPFLQAGFGGAKVEPSMRYIASAHTFSSAGAANAGSVSMALNKSTQSGTAANLFGDRGGVPRWVVIFGDSTAESGSNAGSNFVIGNYNDAGSGIEAPLQIVRSSGQTTLKGLTINTNFYATQGMGYSGTSWGLNSSGFIANGAFQTVNLFNANSCGDTVYAQANLQPGVTSFIRFYVGGSGNWFQMSNTGIGTSQGGWTTVSDIRVKTEIVPIEDALAKVRTLKGYTYFREDMTEMDGSVPRKAGPLAQEIQAVLPEAIVVGTDEEKTLSVHDSAVIGLLISAINELDQTLDQRITQLETAT